MVMVHMIFLGPFVVPLLGILQLRAVRDSI